MKLTIENIGNVKNAEIEINGISVIAGQNGTGKSTISRSLFSIFSANYDVIKKISNDRTKAINDFLEDYLSDIEMNRKNNSEIGIARRIVPSFLYTELTKIISKNLLIFLDKNYSEHNNESLKKSIIESINEFNKRNSKYFVLNIKDLDLNVLSENIKEILSQSDQSIFNQILTAHLTDEFHNQINNIYDPLTGLISLRIKDEQINVEVNKNRATADKLINFKTDVVYIDAAAAIVENLFSTKFLNEFLNKIDLKLDHNAHLMEQLRDERNNTYTLRAKITDRLNLVFNEINHILKTDIVNSSEDEEDEKKLNIINYSSGMKTFYLIKSLLENGVIRENGTLILDEPEVHLHPEWQLKFAEIIVLLQKEFGLHILINSHSPYLVEAIDIFSKKNDTNDSVKYYLANSSIEDVTDSIDKIYEQMYVPLNRLEELAEDFDGE
ncbi:AAA family ATPase [Streptococcus pseudopneumoniae]|uniref:ABC transporter ATP-binding protein n=1 Tax=Streptococcus pseudopneumoniae TaxID=257758 RepID=A0A2P0A0H7_9STRE|nr:AAA family ATPase [Streptococcus pseudopneumoniae]CEY61960.1 ABC transporter ATP-binding protein [Streptococcus pseudopneumoniae]CIP47065.1 ABC transporter ATP-binding protein [Streptococcus pseudopneumoniae]